MRTFSIDLASHEGHIACAEGDRVVALTTVGCVNDTELISLVDDVIKKAGWEPKDIERVACNLGPGGFTSVRSGVTFANALAHQLDVPLSGYHGSALARARIPTATFWIHSTRREHVFIQGGPWSEPTLLPLSDLLETDAGVTGDLIDEHKAALAALGAIFPVPIALEEVLPQLLGNLSYRKEALVPWYGRGI